MTIFDITCICFRNAINADPNYYMAVGSRWLCKWVTARSLATRPGRRGVGVGRLASDMLLLERAVQCPSLLLPGRVRSSVDVKIGRNWVRSSCRDYGPLRADIVEGSLSKPVESIINLHLLYSLKSIGIWMFVCMSPSTILELTMSVVGNREFYIAS
jgi:hypothetical protein